MDRLSSELLGFAPDARVLIVNCDDFGMHDAVNAAVVESIESGIVSSCSLMVPCPAAANAMRLLRERPHIPFGIHLTIIRESPDTCASDPRSYAQDPDRLLQVTIPPAGPGHCADRGRAVSGSPSISGLRAALKGTRGCHSTPLAVAGSRSR